MTKGLLIWIFLLPQMYPNVLSQECMSLSQINTVNRILCHQQRYNKDLWQKVIDCHIPISEQFMRESNEARCPSPKTVEDPTDTNFSIQDVFFNVCGLVDGGILNQISAGICILAGQSNPYIMSHSTEVAAVKATWGNDVPCNIGRCILGLGII